MTTTDAYQDAPHSYIHCLRCDTCGGIETVYGCRTDEETVERAEEQHGNCWACVYCGDHIGPDELSAIAHRECSEEGSFEVMKEWTKIAPLGEFLARLRDGEARRAAFQTETERQFGRLVS